MQRPPLPSAAAGGKAAAASAAAAAAAAAGAGSDRAWFGVALWNSAPLALPFAGAELALEDRQGALPGVELRPLAPTAAAGVGTGGAGGPTSIAPGAWFRLLAEVPVRRSGALAAVGVMLRLGAGASVAFRLGALPQAGPAPVGLLDRTFDGNAIPFSALTGCARAAPSPPVVAAVWEGSAFSEGWAWLACCPEHLMPLTGRP